MFALVDGNNFYASCERVFQPELRNKPLVVLSNNDGCCIARSAEAKALGIRMAQPIFEVPPEIRRKLAVRSANFTLYGDMSARVVAILRDVAPHVEVYSVDESFLDLHGVRDRVAFARDLCAKIHRWTGIPNCIGIAPTKTLVKLKRPGERGWIEAAHAGWARGSRPQCSSITSWTGGTKRLHMRGLSCSSAGSCWQTTVESHTAP